jgi:YggT family protein
VDFFVDVLRLFFFVFMILLLARVVLSLVIVFSRDWKPTGIMLVIVEGVYSVTDPPVKALRRIIPPISLGALRLDLGFLILLIGCSFAYQILGAV